MRWGSIHYLYSITAKGERSDASLIQSQLVDFESLERLEALVILMFVANTN
jgi:hypothetical protein